MRIVADRPYRPGIDRCMADLHLPDASREADCLIMVHGGGLTACDKADVGYLTPLLTAAGWAVLCPNYRLLQHAPWPACIEDIAAAVAWTRQALAAEGIALRRLFLSGISAGAYLAAMVALDRRWLAAHGMDPSCLAGAIPLSGQMTSHFAYRSAIGHPPDQPLIDQAAPLWHVRADAPPLLLVAGSEDMPCRPEENLYMAAALRTVGHRHVACHIIPGRTHSTITAGLADPADPVTRLLHGFLANPA